MTQSEVLSLVVQEGRGGHHEVAKTVGRLDGDRRAYRDVFTACLSSLMVRAAPLDTGHHRSP